MNTMMQYKYVNMCVSTEAMAATTQRTSAALMLAPLACQLVALTGTPIVSSKAHPLIKWLRLCVPFAVNSINFWSVQP